MRRYLLDAIDFELQGISVSEKSDGTEFDEAPTL